MPRTTAEAVAGILEVDEEIDLTPFIELANDLVTEKCAAATVIPAYSDARLEMIERFLSAHLYAIRDPRTTGQGVKGITENFNLIHGLGLKGTQYGQQAMLWDTRGGLATLDAQTTAGRSRRVGITSLGSGCGCTDATRTTIGGGCCE